MSGWVLQPENGSGNLPIFALIPPIPSPRASPEGQGTGFEGSEATTLKCSSLNYTTTSLIIHPIAIRGNSGEGAIRRL